MAEGGVTMRARDLHDYYCGGFANELGLDTAPPPFDRLSPAEQAGWRAVGLEVVTSGDRPAYWQACITDGPHPDRAGITSEKPEPVEDYVPEQWEPIAFGRGEILWRRPWFRAAS